MHIIVILYGYPFFSWPARFAMLLLCMHALPLACNTSLKTCARQSIHAYSLRWFDCRRCDVKVNTYLDKRR